MLVGVDEDGDAQLFGLGSLTGQVVGVREDGLAVPFVRAAEACGCPRGVHALNLARNGYARVARPGVRAAVVRRAAVANRHAAVAGKAKCRFASTTSGGLAWEAGEYRPPAYLSMPVRRCDIAAA